ncbi:DUF397 domain-containing protein [Streptomyces antimycoticus]|uniref:DUF397 domain-containing protein n=1 Tax=Streptomyces TaxID=1883 RepID=UPI000F76A604|nr:MULTISPECIES: DUF397 domain-containing protein [Streptomyces]AJZ85790.2 DUF397 domain-containing protein [Streptomyces sp. AgN23]RSS34952.1 DUF397 domain-containing protein [Streptomyces sp. WAC05858]WJD99303.1 DUF397 domain-containing protein [Streptomyces antimycoticus]
MNTSETTTHHRPHWRKSSYSAGEGQCVEVAVAGGRVQLRESDAPGTVLTTVPPVLAAFVRSAKAGAFDA